MLKQYIAPLGEDRVALFRVDRGEDARMVAVDPYTAKVLDSWSEYENIRSGPRKPFT